jgi:hypothetical protein
LTKCSESKEKEEEEPREKPTTPFDGHKLGLPAKSMVGQNPTAPVPHRLSRSKLSQHALGRVGLAPVWRLYLRRPTTYNVAELVRMMEFGMSTAINAKAARILCATLSIAAGSTLAGCASMSLATSGSAESNGPYRVLDASTNESRPNADKCHVWRDVLLDSARVSVNTFSLFGLPVVLIRDASCPI